MRGQRGNHHGGKWHGAVFVALARAHHDLIAREVDVLHPQARGLEQAQTGSVKQEGHDALRPAELADEGADLVASQHDGQAN
jgi:hypothetical protein